MPGGHNYPSRIRVLQTYLLSKMLLFISIVEKALLLLSQLKAQFYRESRRREPGDGIRDAVHK